MLAKQEVYATPSVKHLQVVFRGLCPESTGAGVKQLVCIPNAWVYGNHMHGMGTPECSN